MLHAAAMLTGIFLLWLLVVQPGTSPQGLAIGTGVALACVVLGARLGGVTSAFARAPFLAVSALGRLGVVLRGALSTIRAAVAADIALKPALVRLKTRVKGVEASAALAAMISASPGMVVVETDAEGLLVHVLDEDAVGAADLGRLEDRVLAVEKVVGE
jgi:multisubunit Na+/H+ antiporter MnhE subunit